MRNSPNTGDKSPDLFEHFGDITHSQLVRGEAIADELDNTDTVRAIDSTTYETLLIALGRAN